MLLPVLVVPVINFFFLHVLEIDNGEIVVFGAAGLRFVGDARPAVHQ